MNCRGASRRLSAYIDNELSPGIRQAVEDHLKSCAACNRKLNELSAIVDAARSLPHLEVSQGFAGRVLESARAGQESGNAFYGFRMRVVLAGLAFVGAAAVVFMFAGPISNNPSSIGPAPDVSAGIGHPSEQPAGAVDFTDDPKIKIESFPIPEGAKPIDRMEDSLMLADSSSKIDEFVLPVIEETKEKVSITRKF